jgi:hypothetical protein
VSATLEELWPGVKAAAPDDPAPLLVAADKCDEVGKPDLAYALRWCAGKKRRPFLAKKAIGGGRRDAWQWFTDWKLTTFLLPREVKVRKPAILPAIVFTAGRYEHPWIMWANVQRAYDWLGFALANLRVVVEVPNIVLPPQPEIVRAGPVTCAACGIMRDRDKLDCPVCKSSEVK